LPKAPPGWWSDDSYSFPLLAFLVRASVLSCSDVFLCGLRGVVFLSRYPCFFARCFYGPFSPRLFSGEVLPARRDRSPLSNSPSNSSFFFPYKPGPVNGPFLHPRERSCPVMRCPRHPDEVRFLLIFKAFLIPPFNVRANVLPFAEGPLHRELPRVLLFLATISNLIYPPFFRDLEGALLSCKARFSTPSAPLFSIARCFFTSLLRAPFPCGGVNPFSFFASDAPPPPFAVLLAFPFFAAHGFPARRVFPVVSR